MLVNRGKQFNVTLTPEATVPRLTGNIAEAAEEIHPTENSGVLIYLQQNTNRDNCCQIDRHPRAGFGRNPPCTANHKSPVVEFLVTLDKL
jgi:hypothetical protein